jgi:hypothetical protein
LEKKFAQIRISSVIHSSPAIRGNKPFVALRWNSIECKTKLLARYRVAAARELPKWGEIANFRWYKVAEQEENHATHLTIRLPKHLKALGFFSLQTIRSNIRMLPNHACTP